MKKLNYRGLILDFGAVITKLPFEELPMIERGFGLKQGALNWFGPLDPARDKLWQDVEAGRITERDYWPMRAQEIAGPRGETWSSSDLFVRIVEMAGESWLRPEMIRTIEEARSRGTKVGILSNELELFIGKVWMKKFSVFSKVDALVDATTTQVFKPDPGSYKLALQSLGLEAHEALFVDDQPRNVEGARAVGIDAVHMDITNVSGSIAEVRRKLGLD